MSTNAKRSRAWYKRLRESGGRRVCAPLDKETYAQLRAYADKHGMSTQAAVLKIIKEHT